MKDEDFAKIADTNDSLKLRVWAQTGASAWRDVTLTKEQVDACRDDETGKLLKDVLEEKATELAFDGGGGMPSLCAHCNGWGQSGKGIEIGDWEPEDGDEAVIVLKSR